MKLKQKISRGGGGGNRNPVIDTDDIIEVAIRSSDEAVNIHPSLNREMFEHKANSDPIGFISIIDNHPARALDYIEVLRVTFVNRASERNRV